MSTEQATNPTESIANPIMQADNEETKCFPAVQVPQVVTAQEEFVIAQEKEREAQQQELEKVNKDLDLFLAQQAEEAAKAAAIKEEARWAVVGSPESATTQNTKEVNVLEENYKRGLKRYYTSRVEQALEAAEDVTKDLNEAIKTNTNRDLEVRVERLGDFGFLREIRYLVSLHKLMGGDNTLQMEWCTMEIPVPTGWPIRIIERHRSKCRETKECQDEHELEAFFGEEAKKMESSVLDCCMAFKVKSKFKF